MKRKLFSGIKRAYLLRMLLTTLAAGCIPLILISSYTMKNEQNKMHEFAWHKISVTADSAAKQFEQYIDLFDQVNQKFRISPVFSDLKLEGAISEQQEAVQAIANLKVFLPVIKEFGLYWPDKEMVYVANAKYYSDVYSHFVLNTEPELFESLFEPRKKAYCIEWDKLKGKGVYIAPICKGGSRDVEKYGFFIFDESTMVKTMSSMFAGRYNIWKIEAADGTIIYENALNKAKDKDIVPDENLFCEARSTDGWSVTLCAKRSDYQEAVDSIAYSVRNILIICIVMCVVLLLSTVLFNYGSVNRVLKTIDINQPNTHTFQNEIDYILSAFSNQSEETVRLNAQLSELRHRMITRAFENMLNGESVSEDALKLLRWTDKPYFILVYELQSSKKHLDELETFFESRAMFAIEMKKDGFMCIIFQGDNSSINKIVHEICDVMNQAKIDMGIGVSLCHEKLDYIALAYIEAAQALVARNEESISLAEDLPLDKTSSIVMSMPIAQITLSLRTGDSFAAEYILSASEQIMESYVAYPQKMFALRQLINDFIKVLDMAGTAYSMERFVYIAQLTDLNKLIAEMHAYVIELCQAQAWQMEKLPDDPYMQTLNFIDSHYTEADFGVSSVAEFLGISVPSASKTLKQMFGVNFKKIINEKRLDQAREMLTKSDVSVADISTKLGFYSTSYFIRIFRESTGMTPAKYRKEHKQSNV